MSITAGDETVAAGTLALAIYDKLNTEFGVLEDNDDDTNRKKFAAAIAQAVAEHLKANADVVITTSMSGLQRDPATSDPTLAPASNVTLAGAVD